ncbi:MAG: DsbA family protein [Patescibacteria group bacterium]|jgi:protein-disulfide isomerase
MKNNEKTPNYVAFVCMVFILIILLIIIIAVFRSSNTKNLTGSQTQVKIEPGIVSTVKEQTLSAPKSDTKSPTLGDAKAPISIFEYSSFSCRSSREIQSTLQAIIKSYSGKVKLIWKDLPLREEYPNSLIAHIGARCAQNQGKFWEYANLLWQDQNNFSTSSAMTLAKKLKLDTNLFSTCLESPEIKTLIANDEQEANELAIPGTPHFYINNQEISGVGSIDDFKKLIDAELNRKN